MTDTKKRTIARKDLPAWAKDAASGEEFVMIPKEITARFIDGDISGVEYRSICDKCKIVIVE